MTEDEIIDIAREAGLPAMKYMELIPQSEWDQLIRFAKLVAAKEREACAKLCDDTSDWWANPQRKNMHSRGIRDGFMGAAQAIKARGESK